MKDRYKNVMKMKELIKNNDGKPYTERQKKNLWDAIGYCEICGAYELARVFLKEVKK